MSPDATPERRWILARGLRTLVNKGNSTALEILGYAPASALDVVWKTTTPQRVEINQLLPSEFESSNPSGDDARVILLLTMDAPGKGKGRRKSRYQIWQGKIAAGGKNLVSKRIHFVDKSAQAKEPGTYRLIVTVKGALLEERTMRFER
jgi:hypothetical protein